MLDTDVCIHVLRDRNSVVRARFIAASGTICLSTVSLHELVFGAERSERPEHHRARIADLVSRLELVPFDQDAADHAGEIRASLARTGQKIGPYDSLIAGHARSMGLSVVTGNLREFDRVHGLRCESWLKEETA
jgi:tRNA(fMet)-specific endonuclease VapC